MYIQLGFFVNYAQLGSSILTPDISASFWKAYAEAPHGEEDLTLGTDWLMVGIGGMIFQDWPVSAELLDAFPRFSKIHSLPGFGRSFCWHSIRIIHRDIGHRTLAVPETKSWFRIGSIHETRSPKWGEV